MANTFNLDNIRVLTHSAIRIQSNAGTVVYVDPYDLTDETHDADFVLVGGHRTRSAGIDGG